MKITSEIQLSGLADSKMREAIGAVCVHYALLELMVERVIANLEGKPGTVTYQEDLSHRTDRLKALARDHSSLEPAQKEAIRLVAVDIKASCQDRHRVIHSLWGMNESGELVSLFPRAKDRTPDKPMDREAIRKVKKDAWQLYLRLLPFADPDSSAELPWPRKPLPKGRPGPKSRS